MPVLGEAKALRAEKLLATVEKTELYTEDLVNLSKKLEGKNVEEAINILSKERFIAKTGAELEDYLSKLVSKPNLEKYSGDWYRTIGNGRDPLLTHYIPRGKAQRYSKVGEDGLFFSSSKEGNFQELKHWDVPIEGNTTTIIYKDVISDGLLDLTNPKVRENIGVTLEQITTDSYEFTDVIGTWARKNGYNGIIYPSARGTEENKYFINVILFKSGTANDVIKGKTILKILN